MQSDRNDNRDKQVEAADPDAAPDAANAAEVFSDEQLEALLEMPQVIDAIYANEKLCNEIIVRFLQELGGQKSAPVVRGKSALSPLPRPKTLAEAKKIVDRF